MSDKQSNFNETVSALFKGLDGFLSTKTVVGEAMKIGEDIYLPLADVSFGIGASATDGEKKEAGMGGMGAKMMPAAVLRIGKNGTTELISLKNQTAVNKVLDMAPGFVSRFMKKDKDQEPNFDHLFEDEATGLED